MYSSQLSELIQKDPIMKTVFAGTFPRDKLPKLNLQHNSAFVINSAPSNKKEGHWLLAFFDVKSRTVVWFDSLGRRPRFYSKSLSLWLHSSGFKLDYSSKVIQAVNSRLCGLFVLNALFFLSRGYTLRKVLSQFSSELKKNDRIVSLFAWGKFHFNVYKEIF